MFRVRIIRLIWYIAPSYYRKENKYCAKRKTFIEYEKRIKNFIKKRKVKCVLFKGWKSKQKIKELTYIYSYHLKKGGTLYNFKIGVHFN